MTHHPPGLGCKNLAFNDDTSMDDSGETIDGAYRATSPSAISMSSRGFHTPSPRPTRPMSPPLSTDGSTATMMSTPRLSSPRNAVMSSDSQSVKANGGPGGVLIRADHLIPARPDATSSPVSTSPVPPTVVGDPLQRQQQQLSPDSRIYEEPNKIRPIDNQQLTTIRPPDADSSRAAVSGMTTILAVSTLITQIVCAAVPHWGGFRPRRSVNVSIGSLPTQDATGHFGPFQTCKKNVYFYSYCGQDTHFATSGWLVAAGIFAVITVTFLSFVCLFSILHVAMQVQRRQIFLPVSTCVFLKVVLAMMSVITCLFAIGLGSIQFVAYTNDSLLLSIGVCFYLEVVCAINCCVLACICYYSYRHEKHDPSLFFGPQKSANYIGQPYEMKEAYSERPLSPPYGERQDGFTPASLVVDPTFGRPVRTVQAGIAQPFTDWSNYYQECDFSQATQQDPTNQMATGGNNEQTTTAPPPVPPHQSERVSLAPQGGQRFLQIGRASNNSAMAGSMESLNSNNSSTLSMNSTLSTVSSVGPFRSSMKKPKNRDNQSITSETSSKRVRISLGSEQTCV